LALRWGRSASADFPRWREQPAAYAMTIQPRHFGSPVITRPRPGTTGTGHPPRARSSRSRASPCPSAGSSSSWGRNSIWSATSCSPSCRCSPSCTPSGAPTTRGPSGSMSNPGRRNTSWRCSSPSGRSTSYPGARRQRPGRRRRGGAARRALGAPAEPPAPPRPEWRHRWRRPASPRSYGNGPGAPPLPTSPTQRPAGTGAHPSSHAPSADRRWAGRGLGP